MNVRSSCVMICGLYVMIWIYPCRIREGKRSFYSVSRSPFAIPVYLYDEHWWNFCVDIAILIFFKTIQCSVFAWTWNNVFDLYLFFHCAACSFMKTIQLHLCSLSLFFSFFPFYSPCAWFSIKFKTLIVANLNDTNRTKTLILLW